MENIYIKCPQCNQMADHTFVGNQQLPERKDGRFWRDDNGNVVYNEVELWTCDKCGSTWVKVK